jgi:hypothetical protein
MIMKSSCGCQPEHMGRLSDGSGPYELWNVTQSAQESISELERKGMEIQELTSARKASP